VNASSTTSRAVDLAVVEHVDVIGAQVRVHQVES
jgi:hypothetical protein